MKTLNAGPASAALSTVAVGGFDLVSYQTAAKPVRGNGNHVAVHDGATYLFSSESNKAEFDADPDKYLPAFGGYCAFGVSVGKKFIGDPDVWEVVDGTLYLCLDNKIKGMWNEDVPAKIAEANAKWPGIKDKSPSEL